MRIKITVYCPFARTQVKVTDHLPAGLELVDAEGRYRARFGGEPLDPLELVRRFAASEAGRESWYDHLELRDDRAEAFASLLPPGVHELRLIARSTTSGTYTAPPAMAEELYSPEIRGESAQHVVRIAE